MVQLANLVLIGVAPAHSPIKTIADLKGRTIGVVGLNANQRLIATLMRSYGFDQAAVQFVDVPFGALAEAAARRNSTP